MFIKRVKKLLRLAGLVCMILLALCGIGLTGTGPLFSRQNEGKFDELVKTEYVQKKDDEEKSDEAKE